jgi:hypothetical protein
VRVSGALYPNHPAFLGLPPFAPFARAAAAFASDFALPGITVTGDYGDRDYGDKDYGDSLLNRITVTVY